MALGERRRADLGQPARRPGGPRGPSGDAGRRGDRVRRFTTAGVAAAMAIMARHSGRVLPDEEPAPVEVGATEARASDPRPFDRGDVEALIEEAAAAHGVSAHLVRAVIQAESAFDPAAVSPAGAQGLMQLMPTTAALMGVEKPLDPRENVFGGVKYLSRLLERFDGNVALALAGYNAGPSKVARYRGIPPYGETRGYVTKIRTLLAESTGASFPLPKPAVVRASRHPTSMRRARAALVAERPRVKPTPRRAGRSGNGRRS